jgi:transcriptional regulator with XRE-family HTH domain
MNPSVDHCWAFAKVLAKRRQRFGFSQAGLAITAGIAEGTLAGLETGTRWPHMQNIIKIAAALNTTPSALLKEAGL